MLTASEFADWFADYRGRFPAVGDYVDRQELPAKLLDTWHHNLAAFDTDVLAAVTNGIVAGDWEPVANVSLGTFGSEVRKLCREVLEARRRTGRRQEWQQHQAAEPLLDGSAIDGVYAGLAVDALLEERTGQKPDARDAFTFTEHGSCHWDHPNCGAYCAAIILADDHTAYEEEQCLKTLASHGLTWDEVRQRAAELKASGMQVGIPSVGPSIPDAAVRYEQPTKPQPVAATAGFPPEQEVEF